MPRDRRKGTEDEAARIEAARSQMAWSRAAAARGRGLLGAVFTAAGVGDWELAPCWARRLAVACRRSGSAASRAAFHRLAARVEARAGRLFHRPVPDGQPDYLLPLQRLSETHAAWRRQPETWTPRGTKPLDQFRQLAQHLLPAVTLDGFFKSTFFLDSGRQLEEWLGRTSERGTASGDCRPLPLTRRMGYHLLLAWPGRDPIRAVRWAQIRGLGGGEPLARAVAHTRLGSQLWEPAEEIWWLAVLHWFVNHPELDLMDVAPVVDYLAERRYGVPEREAPPDSHFSVKGRTAVALLRLLEGWDRAAASALRFRPSDIQPGRWETVADGERCVWTTHELLDQAALREEGFRMRHCVALYVPVVEQGRCAIWSLRVNRAGVLRRALTIRVALPARTVVEYRGHGNRAVKPQEFRILAHWATENGLTLALPERGY
jgi:hypothetical protein